MQSNSINRDRINWIDFRAQVTQRAQGAQTIADAYPAISLALGLLGDHHSFYTAPGGALVSNPAGKRCSALPASTPLLPGDVGYVRVGSFGGSDPSAMTAFADSIQQQIRSTDSAELSGWIVDVRGNGGGNMWPMVAGVGPVLGDGVAGYSCLHLGRRLRGVMGTARRSSTQGRKPPRPAPTGCCGRRRESPC